MFNLEKASNTIRIYLTFDVCSETRQLLFIKLIGICSVASHKNNIINISYGVIRICCITLYSSWYWVSHSPALLLGAPIASRTRRSARAGPPSSRSGEKRMRRRRLTTREEKVREEGEEVSKKLRGITGEGRVKYELKMSADETLCL